MNARIARRLRSLVSTAGGLAFVMALGCNSFSPGAAEKSSSNAPATTVASLAASSGSNNPGIDLQCAANHIQKAPAPFHWSFKKIVTPDTNEDWEANVTADSIAGTLIDGSGARAIHGVRSDSTGWNTAVLVLAGPLPASTFALVDNSSATTRAGTENVNGENTIKYAIDTSQDTPADASLIKSMLGEKGFVKGAAWVTPQGCPVKFVLDVEQHNNDGTVQKEHYEENVTRP
ncbi:MAG TPA: hypothetical protein VGR93_11190 [Candidatus Acidoferrales bacterium]|nr:hypothetical protein [Candidatus Acidoferrales bacterium]